MLILDQTTSLRAVMSDPLSITFGVIGTTAVALQAVQKLKSFIDGIEGAPGAIKNLSTGLETLNNVIQTLQSTLTDSHTAEFHARARVFQLLNEPLRNCIGIVDLVSEKLNPFIKQSGRSSKSKRRSFVWTYREKEFTDLKTLLLPYKSSLEIALSAATLCVALPLEKLRISSL